ncbi:MAG: hypothetical protein R8M38_07745 [Mariprofundaceae bacterium]
MLKAAFEPSFLKGAEQLLVNFIHDLILNVGTAYNHLIRSVFLSIMGDYFYQNTMNINGLRHVPHVNQC